MTKVYTQVSQKVLGKYPIEYTYLKSHNLPDSKYVYIVRDFINTLGDIDVLSKGRFKISKKSSIVLFLSQRYLNNEKRFFNSAKSVLKVIYMLYI